MNVLHRMIMSYGGELLAWYRDLLQSHHEYVSSADSRLKGYEERVAATILEAKKDEEILRLKATPPEFASFFRGQFQDLVREFLTSDEFSRVQGELLSLAASAGFERWLSMHRTKDEFVVVLKKMAHFVPGALSRLAEVSSLIAQTNYAFLNKIYKHAVEPLYVILQLEPEKLACPVNVLASRDARVSPPITKESTVKPAFESLELPANVVLASSFVASEQNKEWVNAMVNGPDPEMTDGATHAKSKSTFVQGTSYVLDDVADVTVIGSKHISSGPTDVGVILSIGKKGDGPLRSSVADKEATANPFGFRLNVWLSIQQILSHATRSKSNGFLPETFSIAGQASIGSMGLLSLPESKIVLSCLAIELAWLLAR
ncbi:hypothetical protein Tco_0749703 [Tanacetum coccineum]|uniref:Uncharacterized protein n=1 Tax=Tanacetum coccineum TaxID=301880 RepID=A0ABQ4Z004_9ASTR